MASSAGLLPAGPYMATYYATKSYVVSITKAVAEELKEQGSNIYVGADVYKRQLYHLDM